MSEFRKASAKVIVWEGKAPKQWVLSGRWPFLRHEIANPVGHPRCERIVEFHDGHGPIVTYSREET